MSRLNMKHLLILSVVFSPVSCNTLQEAHILQTYLFNNYSTLLFPVMNQNDTVKVNISMSLLTINELAEIEGTLSVLTLITVMWKDERLMWEPDKYGGKQSLLVPLHYVWRPPLTVANSATSTDNIGSNSSYIRIFSDGSILWTFGTLLKSSCSLSVVYYPYDIQTCAFIFTPLVTLPDEMVLVNSYDVIDMSLYSPNSEWHVLKTFAGSFVFREFSVARFVLEIERRPIYFLMNVIFPIVLLGLLNSFVFLMPGECGERISYAVTSYLSLAVFLTIVGGNMPKTSVEISLLSYFLTLTLIYSSTIIIAVILMQRLYHKDGEEPVPASVVFLCCLCCHKYPFHSQNKTGEKSQNAGIQHHDDPVIQVRKLQWKKIATRIDFVIFILFLSWHLASMAGFYLAIYNRIPTKELHIV